MEKICKLAKAALIIFGICVFAILCVGTTVVGQAKAREREEELYYDALEKKYVQQLGSFLKDKGYGQSGITMTCQRQENGERCYTVLIHHHRIDILSEMQREELKRECQKIEFPEKNCVFYHQFLICESAG